MRPLAFERCMYSVVEKRMTKKQQWQIHSAIRAQIVNQFFEISPTSPSKEGDKTGEAKTSG
ncbi:hypothetical protein GCM10008915_60080 [Bifidobacterium pullorum subsp. gallinarum]